MNATTVRGSHRLDMVNGRHQRRSASALAALGSNSFGALKAIAIVIIAVSLGLVGTGGTYAYLNASAPAAPGATIKAGTASLSVGTQSLNWSALAPGTSATGTFTITNTGDVSLALSAVITANAVKMTTGAAVANPLALSVATGACPASGVPTGTLSGTLAPGATTSACLVVTLPADALADAQSTQVAISVNVSGVQS
ncbi:TasA family protein [Rhodoglobus sp. NPDC076762]